MRIITRTLAGAGAVALGLPLAVAIAQDGGERTTDTAGDPDGAVPLSLAEEVPADAGSLLPEHVRGSVTTGQLPASGADDARGDGADGPTTDGSATGGSATDGADGPGAAPDDAAAPQLVDGHLLREVGQVAGLADDAGRPLVELVVTSIETAQTCPSRIDVDFEPVHGHYLVVEVTAAMAEHAGAELGTPEEVYLPLAADFFTVLGPDGREQPGTLTESSWSCYTIEELIAPSIVPGETDSGYVVLDVTAETGTLVYDPSGTGTGWAWEF